jgi:hypothetical protein
VLEVEFAIVMTSEMPGGERGCLCRVEAAVQEVARIHEACG